MNNKQAISILSKLARSGSMPHALLLTGQDAAEKEKTASALGRWMLHEAQDGGFASFLERECACASCREVDRAAHPDFVSIDDEVPSVAQIRSLKRHLSLSAFSGPRKIAILTHADGMRKEAANALLKILEEPKSETLLILIARSRSAIYPTLSSRSAEIRFVDTEGDIARRQDLLARRTKALNLLQDPEVYKGFGEARLYNLQNKAELLEILDAWLLRRRDDLEGCNRRQAVQSLKQIFAAKALLTTGNSNPQLILERLVINN